VNSSRTRLHQIVYSMDNAELASYIDTSGEGEVNVPDSYYMTPLMDAFRTQNVIAVRMLVQHGARFDVITPSDDSPLWCAYRTGINDILTLCFDLLQTQPPVELVKLMDMRNLDSALIQFLRGDKQAALFFSRLKTLICDNKNILF
jgi:ankyrin repeat protein